MTYSCNNCLFFTAVIKEDDAVKAVKNCWISNAGKLSRLTVVGVRTTRSSASSPQGLEERQWLAFDWLVRWCWILSNNYNVGHVKKKKLYCEMIGYGFTAASATGWCWVRIPAEWGERILVTKYFLDFSSLCSPQISLIFFFTPCC